jgi:spore maturation protein CgeB
VKVIYSFNKKGREAQIWERELAESSASAIEVIPFNHDPYLDVRRYMRAQLLDNLYYEQAAGLVRLYSDIEALLSRSGADVLLVDNCPPYHPEFLRRLSQYKVLRVNDGPLAAYDRDFAYLHAYDHVLYHSDAYSKDLTMSEKLEYCKAKRHDLWPLALFDAAFDGNLSERELFSLRRDVDVAFVGSFTRGKMPELARIKKYFGRRCVMHGLTSPLRNVYFNLKFGFPGWMTPLRIDDFARLYRRSKIGFNIHNRGKYTVGNFRLFELPANGAMQVSDGGEFLQQFFTPEEEIICADDTETMLGKIDYFLSHDAERESIAISGYRAVMARHRFKSRVIELERLLRPGIVDKQSRTLDLHFMHSARR